jgi:hypothetical protein
VSYAGVVSGLHAVFATVTAIKGMQEGEPEAVHVAPYLYTVLDSFERSEAAQVVSMRYRSVHTVLFDAQKGEYAENDLQDMVNRIPAAVSANKQLSGTLTQGIAQIVSATAGWTLINGKMYRSLDFVSEVLEKGAKGSAI